MGPAAAWDEHFTLSFWAWLVCLGIAEWNAPGSQLGGDTTKLHFWETSQSHYWTPTGGQRQTYVSGQNGAPEESDQGLLFQLGAPPVDAAYAGMGAAYNIRDRIQVLKHVPYSGSRGGFTPTPGEAGHHLNGFGVLNKRQFTSRDLVDNKKGISLEGSGSAGGVLIYHNGFLAPHEYEDVTIKGVSFRAYGRQTVVRTV